MARRPAEGRPAQALYSDSYTPHTQREQRHRTGSATPDRASRQQTGRASGPPCARSVTMHAMTPANHPQLRVLAPSAAPEEAAAIVAAVERFMRATAPSSATPPEASNGWRRAALLEGTSREPTSSDLPNPWINT